MPRSVVVAALAGMLLPGLFVGGAPRAAAQDATPAAATADCPETTPEENKALVQRFV